MTAREGRLAYLDGWRGIAVILVMVGHFLPVPFMNVATFGVELFFVLSGRLMAHILFEQQMPLPRFFQRRINRVYPALLVFVLVVFVWSHFVPEFPVGPKAVLTALLFLSNYSIWIPGLYRTGFYDHLWSLSVEEHSYVILAGVMLLCRRFRLAVAPTLATIAAAAFINGAVSYWLLGQDYFHVYWRTDVHLASIFVAAALWLALKGTKVASGQWVFVAAIVGGVLFSMGSLPLPVINIVGTSCLAIAICTVDRCALAQRLLSSKALTAVGTVSFSLYLWQQPFYQLSESGHMHPLVGIAAAGICALASYFIVEGPARRYLNALADQRARRRLALT